MTSQRITLTLTALLAASTAGAAVWSGPPGTEAPAPIPLGRLLPARAVGAACPLNRAQERRAVDAFDELLPVILHPRCFNCHGGVEPGKPDGGHMGGVVRSPPGATDHRAVCQECHSGLPKWDTPVEGMFFTDKDARDLCMLFKSTKTSGAHFVAHIENDNGGTMFTATAFKGDRGLNTLGEVLVADSTGVPFAVAPPPGTHAEFTDKARTWANAMGAAWQVPGDCGCKVRGDAWVGTVAMVNHWQVAELGLVTDSSWAGVRFEVDPTFDTLGDPTTYWKSVSGSIRWKIHMEGNCTMSAAGRLPIGLGADLNPMAMLSETPGSDGTILFQANIGPWPDAYNPRTTYRCRVDPERVGPMPWGLYAVTRWWHHQDAGMKSEDGTTFKGAFIQREGTRVTTWNWDFRSEP